MSVLPKIDEEKLAEANMMDKVADEVLEEKPTMVIEPVEEQILISCGGGSARRTSFS